MLHYLFYFALSKVSQELAAIRYRLLKDDIIDFPYFFINLNFFLVFLLRSSFLSLS
jgi:hypothetical protein